MRPRLVRLVFTLVIASRPGCRGQAPLVAAGRDTAVLGKMVGDKVTPVGPAQSYLVVQSPQ